MIDDDQSTSSDPASNLIPLLLGLTGFVVWCVALIAAFSVDVQQFSDADFTARLRIWGDAAAAWWITGAVLVAASGVASTIDRSNDR